MLIQTIRYQTRDTDTEMIIELYEKAKFKILCAVCFLLCKYSPDTEKQSHINTYKCLSIPGLFLEGDTRN